jgi:hypothetical protein
MLGLTLIVFIGVCVVVFGTGPKGQAKERQSSGAFLAALLEKLKNSSEKDAKRVEFSIARSTHL